MTTPDSGPRQFAMHTQPLLAALVPCALAGIAAWLAFGGGRAGLVNHDAPPAAEATYMVNVNAAEAEELAQLPGLGPATARRIVEHRRTHGAFVSLDALLDVPGIGPATLAEMRPHLQPVQAPPGKPSR